MPRLFYDNSFLHTFGSAQLLVPITLKLIFSSQKLLELNMLWQHNLLTILHQLFAHLQLTKSMHDLPELNCNSVLKQQRKKKTQDNADYTIARLAIPFSALYDLMVTNSEPAVSYNTWTNIILHHAFPIVNNQFSYGLGRNRSVWVQLKVLYSAPDTLIPCTWDKQSFCYSLISHVILLLSFVFFFQ